MRQPLALKNFDMRHHQGSCANQRANLSLDALIGRLPAYKLRDLLPGRTLTCCPRAERQRKMINLAPIRTAHRTFGGGGSLNQKNKKNKKWGCELFGSTLGL